MVAEEPSQRPARVTWHQRLLRLLPMAIAVLWIAGIGQFRDLGFRPIDYGALLAAALALQIVLGRAQARRAPIVLPEHSNPAVIALLAALLTGTIGLLLGGIAEWAAPNPGGRELPPWSLRTLWHGGCAFGASYCRFLSRLATTPRN